MSEPVKDYPPYLDYPKPRKKQTNADKIRQMTDEELADWVFSHDCKTNLYGYLPREGTFDWLKQEVSDNG